MILHIAKCNEHNIVYVYTNKKALMKDCNKYGFEVQEPIIFNQRLMSSILGAMEEMSIYCGNTIDLTIGNKIGK